MTTATTTASRARGNNWTGWMPPVGDAVLFDRNFRNNGGYSNASHTKVNVVGWVVKGP